MNPETSLRPDHIVKELKPLPIILTKKAVRKIYNKHSSKTVRDTLFEALLRVHPNPTEKHLKMHTVSYNEIIYIVCMLGPLPNCYDPFEKQRVRDLI